MHRGMDDDRMRQGEEGGKTKNRENATLQLLPRIPR